MKQRCFNVDLKLMFLLGCQEIRNLLNKIDEAPLNYVATIWKWGIVSKCNRFT